MNLVFLIGKVEEIKYGLVDRGKIFGIAFINLKVNKVKEPIKLVLKNEIADFAYRNINKKDKIFIQGKVREAKEYLYIEVRQINILQG